VGVVSSVAGSRDDRAGREVEVVTLSAMTIVLLALLAAVADGAPARDDEPAATYDLAADFSLVRNPNGPWEYGFSASTSLAPDRFTLASVADARGTIGFWHPAAAYYPYLASNPTRRTRADPTRSWALRPGEVALEASNTGQPAIVRFVVPRAGRYRVKARFAGIHFGLSSTDVHVLINGVPVFDALIDGYGGDRAFHAIEGRSPRATFVGTRRMAAGAVVTFAVGYGANGTHFNDTTGLRVRIQADPRLRLGSGWNARVWRSGHARAGCRGRQSRRGMRARPHPPPDKLVLMPRRVFETSP